MLPRQCGVRITACTSGTPQFYGLGRGSGMQLPTGPRPNSKLPKPCTHKSCYSHDGVPRIDGEATNKLEDVGGTPPVPYWDSNYDGCHSPAHHWMFISRAKATTVSSEQSMAPSYLTSSNVQIVKEGPPNWIASQENAFIT